MEDYRVTQTGDEIQEILNQSPIDTADIVELKEAATSLDGRLESVEGKIPAGASEENPLTDKQYVDDSIASASATFRGTYNEVTDLELTTEATHADIGSALDEVIELADSNDYCFVQIPTDDETPTEIESIERYKFVTGTGWEYEYTLNNSGFTADQWSAINSGITRGLVTKLADLPTNAELETLLNGKANAADVYTKSETYNKTEMDAQLGAKANSADVYEKSQTYTKQEVDALITTPEVQYVTVTATSGTTSVTDVLPATGAANTIYRVGSWDGTQYATGVYSEYAWNGTTYILLDVKNYGFATGSDFDNPTTAQRELVTTVGSVLDGINEGVFDLTAKTGDSYATLADALTAANTSIPTNKKKGGMSIKYVQTSDNKYVEYMYKLEYENTTAGNQAFINPDNWQKLNLEEEVSQLGQETAKIIDGLDNLGPYNIEAIESSTRVKFEYKLTSTGFVLDAKSYNPIYAIAVTYYDSANTKIYDSGWVGTTVKVHAPNNAVTARVTVKKNQYDTLTVENAKSNVAIICSKPNNDYFPEFGFNVTEFATKYSLGQTTFDTVDSAAVTIPVPYRKVGLIITYKDSNGDWHKYQFAGTSLSDWLDAGNWKNGVDDRFANLYAQGTLINKRITGGKWLNGGYCYLVDMNAYRGAYLKVKKHATNQSFIAFLKSSQPLADDYADFCDGQNTVELIDNSIHSYLIPQDCSVLYVYAGYANATNNYPSIVQVSGVDTVALALSSISSDMVNMQDSLGRISIIPCNTSVKIVAHGGVHINGIPYNSLDAIRYAGKCGFRFVETDIRITSDDKFVIMHDDTINSAMRNASDYSVISETIYINSKTLAELKAGYVLAADDVRMRRTIPTLEEYLVECRRFDIIPIIEIKSSATTHEQLDQIVTICKKIAGDGKFCFDSFYSAPLDYIRSISAKTLLFYMNASGIVNTNNPVTGQSRADGYTIWFPNYLWEIYTQENIDAHKIAGISVAVHTVPANKMNDILLNNADYIFSDSIPISARLVGKVFSSNVDFSDFITDGTIVNQSLTLEVDDTVAVELGSVWMGGCYLRIIANGEFSVTAPNLSVNIDTDGSFKEYCFQSYIDNKDSSLLITATDNTVIQFINYCVAEIH